MCEMPEFPAEFTEKFVVPIELTSKVMEWVEEAERDSGASFNFGETSCGLWVGCSDLKTGVMFAFTFGVLMTDSCRDPS